MGTQTAVIQLDGNKVFTDSCGVVGVNYTNLQGLEQKRQGTVAFIYLNLDILQYQKQTLDLVHYQSMII